MAHEHPTVLVIEDHEDIRESLAELMRREGYRVETAPDGGAALRKLRMGFHPCVIVLDLMMPSMTGFEFREEQLADPDLKDIPVIVCSAMHGLRDLRADLKVNAYVQKPTTITQLMDIVREHCLK